MNAGPWVFTNSARTKMLNGTFAFTVDSFKVALFLSTSNIAITSTTYAALTNQHANANGYTTGGIAVLPTLTGTTLVTMTWPNDPTWTASGGGILARFAVLYEVSGDVVCFALLDATPADVFCPAPLDFIISPAAAGVFTLD